ncbi:hypothetical protein K431DRAFT_286232 [Polychaeton citri CBS 116435]|uniref:Uncharacterized protein n=1 Tax=Polychaeton citri CBS 116435 TaxID=1314669 RepID=A0A9P4Q509_9PEZI|nr:hypothetical protein K431DRAFT_286232 [Polychaeton citri CBS 116435]
MHAHTTHTHAHTTTAAAATAATTTLTRPVPNFRLENWVPRSPPSLPLSLLPVSVTRLMGSRPATREERRWTHVVSAVRPPPFLVSVP